MPLLELLFGTALRTDEQDEQRIGAARGIPVLGLDALSLAAYGPEAALTVLLVVGAAASHYLVPITALILCVFVAVYLSYRQTIEAYPGGGGSYTVASQNLGPYPGLLAASALSLDYVLNVAVGIGRRGRDRVRDSLDAALHAAALARDPRALDGRQSPRHPGVGTSSSWRRPICSSAHCSS